MVLLSGLKKDRTDRVGKVKFVIDTLTTTRTVDIVVCFFSTLSDAPIGDLVWFMVFNATVNHISVISWRSVLLVEETEVPGEKHRPVACH